MKQVKRRLASKPVPSNRSNKINCSKWESLSSLCVCSKSKISIYNPKLAHKNLKNRNEFQINCCFHLPIPNFLLPICMYMIARMILCMRDLKDYIYGIER